LGNGNFLDQKAKNNPEKWPTNRTLKLLRGRCKKGMDKTTHSNFNELDNIVTKARGLGLICQSFKVLPID
jgi:hypothetical protein